MSERIIYIFPIKDSPTVLHPTSVVMVAIDSTTGKQIHSHLSSSDVKGYNDMGRSVRHPFKGEQARQIYTKRGLYKPKYMTREEAKVMFGEDLKFEKEKLS